MQKLKKEDKLKVFTIFQLETIVVLTIVVSTMVMAVEIWEVAGYILKVEAAGFTGKLHVVCKRMKRA